MVLCCLENFVILQPVWSKLQFRNKLKVDRNVEDLSDYRKEGTDW